MKIFSRSLINEWDQYTIKHTPISSIDLMEKASRAFVNLFTKSFDSSKQIAIFCGTGNNGGDGLAIGRMLIQEGYQIKVFVCGNVENGSFDFKTNFERFQKIMPVIKVESLDLINFQDGEIIIDAIFGSGLNRPVEGIFLALIQKINFSRLTVVSVDIASGLPADGVIENCEAVKPNFTYSFHRPKLAFFLKENEEYVGDWQILDIGLEANFEKNNNTKFHYTHPQEINFPLRKKYSHKGTYGNALLVAGQKGMMGAAILASKASLRMGVGKINVCGPKSGLNIIQIAVPEAIYLESQNEDFMPYIWEKENFIQFSAVGIGPGIGKTETIISSLHSFFENVGEVPLIIDADAITCIGDDPKNKLISKVPKGTIFTPHPKEFQILSGKTWRSDLEKLDILSDFALKNEMIIVLKGYQTAVALPSGDIHFNSTGNPGMATAGAGDVLTGIILSLLAQGLAAEKAAILGVYEHGLAGDRAVNRKSERSLIASDIIDHIL